MSEHLTRELEVGFEKVDLEHRVLMRQVDEALAAIQGGDREAVHAAVMKLGDYLVWHFSSEEKLMEETVYPERARHKAAHDLFMQDFLQLSEAEKAGEDLANLSESLGQRVPEWIKFHIQVNDAPLGRYLAARERKPESARPSAKDKPYPS
ncbi:MAG TPA: hemerythrin family protein [Anaeromyxobacteraceae bacterium]|jgi:hemerythrin|nr:hemerythrin family protein [Anaeromyxobacteraceae bacterium]